MLNIEISEEIVEETTDQEDELEPCPICEQFSVVVQGRCKTCYECFWSSCIL